jgi:hypothetical protein
MQHRQIADNRAMSCFDLFCCARRVDSGHRDREVIKNLSTTASAKLAGPRPCFERLVEAGEDREADQPREENPKARFPVPSGSPTSSSDTSW